MTITPRNFPLDFSRAGKMERHYAMIGMASASETFPLYAEAVNEKGLAMAGLNFRATPFIRNLTGKDWSLLLLRSLPGYWENVLP